MRFTKFGKALLMGALLAGVALGITSCNRSYSVGYLYVTGTATASSGSNGIITGVSLDHNTGSMTAINGLPVASGGSNPVRAVLTSGSRFIYVLNRGVANTIPAGGTNADCYGTGVYECTGANITQFTVGGNGSLEALGQTFYSHGNNPFRMIVDSTSSYLMVLDHDAPDSGITTMVNGVPTNSCTLALGSSNTTCGDISVFKIDTSTGRLSTITNAAVTSQNCPTSVITCPLPYFPVPANPVDFVLDGSYVYTLTGAPTPTSYPYTSGTSVWPYSYSSSNGQLTVSANGLQKLTTTAGPVTQANAIVLAGGVIYVLDDESVTTTFNGTSTFSNSQIIPYTAPAGTLNIEPSGVIPDDPCLADPSYLLLETKGKFVYVANQEGNTSSTTCPGSGIAGYFLTTTPSYQLSFIAGEPFGSGTGPQCIVEDPSSQFIYEANGDSTVTGRVLDPNSGSLNNMSGTSTYKLGGPATWCLVDGRTN
jgi:6-phosphogluconolactonase (cycloisomerase 2 family)